MSPVIGLSFRASVNQIFNFVGFNEFGLDGLQTRAAWILPVSVVMLADVIRVILLGRIAKFIVLLLSTNTSLFCANLIISFLFNKKCITSAFFEENGSIARALP